MLEEESNVFNKRLTSYLRLKKMIENRIGHSKFQRRNFYKGRESIMTQNLFKILGIVLIDQMANYLDKNYFLGILKNLGK